MKKLFATLTLAAFALTTTAVFAGDKKADAPKKDETKTETKTKTSKSKKPPVTEEKK